MVQKLSREELQAVIGHELSHIAHRDALVMTVFATPPAVFLRGMRRLHDPDGRLAFALLLGWFALPAAAAASAASRALSRYRELAADRGAAILTGSPSALAAALMRLSEEAHRIPSDDLRLVASHDVFHLVGTTPARYESYDVRWLWATHPSLSERLGQLESLEATLQRRP